MSRLILKLQVIWKRSTHVFMVVITAALVLKLRKYVPALRFPFQTQSFPSSPIAGCRQPHGDMRAIAGAVSK